VLPSPDPSLPSVAGLGGGKPEVDEKGYAHIHAGIHGIGDLLPEVLDLRNPVARVAIRRVS
jgi:hypothetical protein